MGIWPLDKQFSNITLKPCPLHFASGFTVAFGSRGNSSQLDVRGRTHRLSALGAAEKADQIFTDVLMKRVE